MSKHDPIHRKIKGPLPGTGSHTVVLSIHRHGPMTMEEGIKLHGMFSNVASKHRAVYDRAIGAGWLELEAGKYSLTKAMRELLAEKPPAELVIATKAQVLAPPYQPPFKPLKGLPMPLIRPDAQPLRDMSVKTGSVGFFQGYRD